ncbi:cytochrome c oxidase subunit 7B, mitochondrial [Austrofundulus limnaeus]|uniref:Cytochrome c oxidase subunit 7B, mitochondrial n=1 Tax=Austrofundulus limnaeus TaxID=52670 RepID=A0A2I4CX21_AUSLI|nr:PREDICTED: cytochrome c oxidase subunit 7B, mitochondrial-like [Austrofundulus limnaeus]
MYRFAKATADLTGQVVRQMSPVRYGSTSSRSFHAKYGNAMLVGGAVFCTAVWGYVITQGGITWNLSPVNRLTPRPWREAEE